MSCVLAVGWMNSTRRRRRRKKICSSCRRACCCWNKNSSRNRISCNSHCSCCMPRTGTSTEYRTSRHNAELWRSCLQKPCGGRRRRIRIGYRPRIQFRIRRATEVFRAAATWEGESAGGFGNGYSSAHSSGRNMSAS